MFRPSHATLFDSLNDTYEVPRHAILSTLQLLTVAWIQISTVTSN